MASSVARLISLCVCADTLHTLHVCESASALMCTCMSVYVCSQQHWGPSHLIKASYRDVLKALGEDRNVIRHV